MEKPVIGKPQVKEIDDALYRLSLLGPHIAVLKQTDNDTSEIETLAADYERHLLAYKRYAQGDLP